MMLHFKLRALSAELSHSDIHCLAARICKCEVRAIHIGPMMIHLLWPLSGHESLPCLHTRQVQKGVKVLAVREFVSKLRLCTVEINLVPASVLIWRVQLAYQARISPGAMFSSQNFDAASCLRPGASSF